MAVTAGPIIILATGCAELPEGVATDYRASTAVHAGGSGDGAGTAELPEKRKGWPFLWPVRSLSTGPVSIAF